MSILLPNHKNTSLQLAPFIAQLGKAGTDDNGGPDSQGPGLVEEAEGGVGRERRWRAAHEFTTLSLRDLEGDPDAEAALAWLHGEYFAQFAEKARRWAEGQAGWSLEWREAAGASDSMLELTPAELTAMQDEIWAVAERYRTAARARAAEERTAEDADDAEDRHRVFFYMHCLPDTEENR